MRLSPFILYTIFALSKIKNFIYGKYFVALLISFVYFIIKVEIIDSE